jgi:hypothetical protein
MMLNGNHLLICGLEVDRAGAGDLAGIVEMLKGTIPERERLQAAYHETREQKAALKEVIQGVAEDLARGKSILMQRRLEFWEERLANPACAVQDLAGSLSSLEAEVAAYADILDLATEVRLPAAEDRELSADLDLKKVVALEAALLAAESHAREMQRLEAAGVFEGSSRIAFASEKTDKLQLAAAEAHRQAQLATRTLDETRARQLARSQGRQAGGLSRAEATYTAVQLSRSTKTNHEKE